MMPLVVLCAAQIVAGSFCSLSQSGRIFGWLASITDRFRLFRGISPLLGSTILLPGVLLLSDLGHDCLVTLQGVIPAARRGSSLLR